MLVVDPPVADLTGSREFCTAVGSRVHEQHSTADTWGTPAGGDDLRWVRGVRDPDGHAWESMVVGQLHVVDRPPGGSGACEQW